MRDKKQISGGTELAGLPVHTIAFNFNTLHNDDAFVPSGSVKSSYGIDSCPRLSGMDTVGSENKIVIECWRHASVQRRVLEPCRIRDAAP